MITGKTTIIAHMGFPTINFKAPMIYNPWFEARGVDAVVIPIGVAPSEYPEVLRALFRTTNVHGALITMPHKVTTTGLMDEVSTTAKIAGACNAGAQTPRRLASRRYVRRLRFRARHGAKGPADRRRPRPCHRVGRRRLRHCRFSGGGRVGRIGLYDASAAAAEALAGRLRLHYPSLAVVTGSNDPSGYDVVVNATPLGVNPAIRSPSTSTASRPTPSSARW